MTGGIDGVDPVSAIDPERVRGPLRTLYRELDARVAEHGPTCVVSGRCCRFEEYGHTLFLSAAEAALLVADAPPPARTPDDGATCPWQDRLGRCTARDARPLGCRVYFCDPNYEGEAGPITEEFLGRLRRLVESLGLPWGYARMHRHVRAAIEAGLLTAGPGDDPCRGAVERVAAVSGRESLDISPSGQ
ncbi:hypothetical protein [Tautonia plasticadhaerens]|uniref:Flagellin N-methylase n=1 Tax=Tautonia plasticadhaerens TaxID=2527974 RepID=A0A518HB89_9BACT|nr:hypothetical protein [Tautonia plasticadhaerens]QDV38123.1 hypothetical protein ElP_60720 [Tautonia plasticadhaerens]